MLEKLVSYEIQEKGAFHIGTVTNMPQNFLNVINVMKTRTCWLWGFFSSSLLYHGETPFFLLEICITFHSMSVSVYENAGNLRGQRHQLPLELELDDYKPPDVGAKNQNTSGSARSVPCKGKHFFCHNTYNPTIQKPAHQFKAYSKLPSSHTARFYLRKTKV